MPRRLTVSSSLSNFELFRVFFTGCNKPNNGNSLFFWDSGYTFSQRDMRKHSRLQITYAISSECNGQESKIEIGKIKQAFAVPHGDGSRVFASLARSCSHLALKLDYRSERRSCNCLACAKISRACNSHAFAYFNLTLDSYSLFISVGPGVTILVKKAGKQDCKDFIRRESQL